MELDKRVVQFITARFPGCATVIERTYRENPAFRELCRDYKRCDEALEGWKQRDGVGSAERLREYAELLSELRGEIEVWLGGGQVEHGRLGGRGIPGRRKDR